MSALETAKEMTSKFNADAAAGVNQIFQFEIEDGDSFYITISDGSCDIGEGTSDDANVTLIMNSDTYHGIVNGETDGMQAFMAGQLRAEGDMMLATKLGEYFTLA